MVDFLLFGIVMIGIFGSSIYLKYLTLKNMDVANEIPLMIDNGDDINEVPPKYEDIS